MNLMKRIFETFHLYLLLVNVGNAIAKTQNPVFHLVFILSLVVTLDPVFAQSNTTLWYNKPAEYFEETLVLGNGKHGASVFGDVASDQIYLNDATLWAGEPVDPYMNPNAYKHIPAIREALGQEDYRLAERLNKNIQGKFSQSYAPVGTIFIEFKHLGDYKNYHRQLDISEAVATVSYQLDGIQYTREYFISHPDKVMVIRLSGSKKQSLTFDVKFRSLLKYSSAANDAILEIDGYAPYHVEPDYRGSIPDAIRFDENRGTRFSTYVKIKNEGGQVTASDSALHVSNADEATIFVSISTSFNGFDKDPAKNGLDNKAIARKQLVDAFAKSYQTLKENHRKDYQSFFKRVTLDLHEKKIPDLPTDERLKRYTQRAEDKNLEILYFQYGRYLLISSSRTEGVPANLQGIWNPYIRPPWSCNYTMNINAEENYWLAEPANLSEMHTPFLTFIGNLAETGKVTAKTFYGVDTGWAACHNSDIWAMSNPVGDFGKGEPMWACWNMSGTWAVTHLWDHFLYTGDKNFLKDYAYPLMKGAAEFCLAWLVKDKQGFLVTSPSTSPENVYITPDGFTGATLYGSTADIAMIRECFTQTIQASEKLDIDVALRDRLKIAMSQLYPYQIGRKGNLQEWYHDWEDPEPTHRHQSHLFGLYPGHQITPEKTPELANACRKTLEIKGDETTGWSKGWRINLWARLWDGNRAYKLFQELLSYVEPDGAKKINYGGGGGTYPNLFDAHPPFQTDGNFGGAAGVIEMLLQSNEEDIYLLPALPDAWRSGSVSGICARGGFEFSIHWKDGRLHGVDVLSNAGNTCRLNYDSKVVTLDTKRGGSYHLDSTLKLRNE
jgi:alpha-L-fucosidase 2